MLRNWIAANKKRVPYVTGFGELAVDRNLLPELTNIDVIGDATDYFGDCEKINHDLSVHYGFYMKLLDATVQDPKIIRVANIDEKDLEFVLAKCEQIDSKGRNLAARVRVILQRQRGMFAWLLRSRYTRGDRKRFARERRKVDAELSESRTISRIEIDDASCSRRNGRDPAEEGGAPG
jgi:hypothetical protein